MPGVTNSQGLVYPTATHRRCDFPEDWEVLADQLQAKISAVQAINNRTFPTVPAAVLECTTRPVFNNSATFTNWIAFDTVIMDTDGMTNLSADATLVTPTRAGIYQLVGYVQMRVTGDPTNWFELSFGGNGAGITGLTSPSGVDATSTTGDMNNQWAKFLSASNFVAYDPDDPSTSPLTMQATYLGGGPANGTRIDFASFGVYWWSDLP